MKNKIFMYLFFFAVLFIIFQYMNEKKIFENQEKQINSLTKQAVNNDSIADAFAQERLDLTYFTLQGNDNAMTYLEDRGMEAVEVETMVSSALYDTNTANGNDLVPHAGMAGVMQINKLRFLNHKWVLADYTDGKFWGEMIVEYYFDANNQLELKVLDSALYAN